MPLKYFLVLLLYTIILNSCAVLHHVQVGEVDGKIVSNGKRFEVLVSELGFDLDEAFDLAKGLSSSKKGRDQLESIQSAIALFQMGPVTGKPIYSSPSYADPIVLAIHEKCPKGRISGLVSIRESNQYPVVSGEIVKIVGYCERSS